MERMIDSAMEVFATKYTCQAYRADTDFQQKAAARTLAYKVLPVITEYTLVPEQFNLKK